MRAMDPTTEAVPDLIPPSPDGHPGDWRRRSAEGDGPVPSRRAKGSNPQAVDNVRSHLLFPGDRRSGGRIHRRIPRTAGLSTVCTAHHAPSPPSSTRPSRRPQNPQPVDNFCAHPGYDRPAPRPPFFPRSPPTGSPRCPRRGKAADLGQGPLSATVAHIPFTACGRIPSTGGARRWTTLPTDNPQPRPQPERVARVSR
jgi:hypothetical protein